MGFQCSLFALVAIGQELLEHLGHLGGDRGLNLLEVEKDSSAESSNIIWKI